MESINAVPTANRRYIELELCEEGTTMTILLTPEEAEGLIEKTQSAIDRLALQKER